VKITPEKLSDRQTIALFWEMGWLNLMAMSEFRSEARKYEFLRMRSANLAINTETCSSIAEISFAEAEAEVLNLYKLLHYGPYRN